jgi:ubiquinone/menaquinone biosynthesis C-methylase UbiE
MNRTTWENNLNSEIDFWNNWLSTKGDAWKDDYIYRLESKTEAVGFFKESLQTVSVDEDYKILDVGAGPMTILGKFYNGVKLNITAVDALAEVFQKLNWQDKKPEIMTEYCETEKLCEKFNENSFDMVYARNTLDHHYDAPLALKNMLQVTKVGGLVVFSHTENEANNNHWEGLHKWNFYLNDDDMVIANQTNSFSLKEIIGAQGKITFMHKDTNNVINIRIEKK